MPGTSPTACPTPRSPCSRRPAWPRSSPARRPTATTSAATRPSPIRPSSEAAAGMGTLEADGYRVVGVEGKSLVDVWLRKATPASGKPSGPSGAVLYPVLADGELIGAVKYAAEGHDYRDQSIPPGVYTMRY